MSDLSEVDFADPGIRRWLSPSAIRVFTNIAEEWNLSESQVRGLLGGISSSTLHAWKSNPDKRVLDKNTLTRISLIIGIYKGLHTYFGDPGDYWITHPNDAPLFGGAVPIDFMVSAGVIGMYEVRKMLDSWSAGHLAERIDRLVKGVVVDPEEPLGEENLLCGMSDAGDIDQVFSALDAANLPDDFMTDEDRDRRPLGGEDSIRQGLDDSAHGRTRPAREVFDEIRRKYGIPDGVNDTQEVRQTATRILQACGLSNDGIDSWWRGLCSYLDDQTPNEVIDDDPEWVLEAAIDAAEEMHGRIT